MILKSLEGSTCSSGNILNRNLEKKTHTAMTSLYQCAVLIFSRAVIFCLRTYCVMLLLGDEQLKNLQK